MGCRESGGERTGQDRGERLSPPRLSSRSVALTVRLASRLTVSVEESASQSARIHALRAPAEVRDHRAIPVMMQVMGEDSALLQHWAIEDRLSFHSYQLHCPRHSLA